MENKDITKEQAEDMLAEQLAHIFIEQIRRNSKEQEKEE